MIKYAEKGLHRNRKVEICWNWQEMTGNSWKFLKESNKRLELAGNK